MRTARVPGAFLMLALAAASMLAGCAAAERPPRADIAATPDVPQPAAELKAPAVGALRVVVSYFHRTIRCETCLKFEELADRALREAFAVELASGRLVWRVADFEEPGHESDVAEYDILESSLIVSRFAGDEEMDWKKLDAIWDLVKDEEVFVQYIQGEVAAYLDTGPAAGGGR